MEPADIGFNCLTGFYKANEGDIVFFLEKSIKKIKPFKITELGMARTFQNYAAGDEVLKDASKF
jgi:ABC-type branched-subunit amino acid transport system ATPase component